MCCPQSFGLGISAGDLDFYEFVVNEEGVYILPAIGIRHPETT